MIYLDAPREELTRRILARAETEGRSDDNEETVQNRLRVFDEATRPLVEYYRERGLLHVVDAAQDADAVTAEILAALDGLAGGSATELSARRRLSSVVGARSGFRVVRVLGLGRRSRRPCRAACAS